MDLNVVTMTTLHVVDCVSVGHTEVSQFLVWIRAIESPTLLEMALPPCRHFGSLPRPIKHSPTTGNILMLAAVLGTVSA